MHLVKRFFHWLLLLILIFHSGLSAVPCMAEIYRWQDEQGHWHFSDSPTSGEPIQEPPIPSWDDPAAKAPVAPDATDTPPESPSTISSAQSSATPVQGGMLWSISRKGLTPSYLLGTIHSADPRVVRLRPTVQQALDRSDRFVMEMQMDPAALLSFGANMMMADGSNLETVLGRDLYNRVVRAMAEYGFPEMVVSNLKPWVVMALLSMPKASGEPVLDMVLQQCAEAAGKPTAGLESAQEQLAVFEGLSMADQIALLKMTIDQLPDLPRFFDRLIRAYAADDLQMVAEMAAEYSHKGDTETIQRFNLRLNDDRNRRMVERMTPYLQQGNSFIAVGALHLIGPAGLIRLLRERGYDVAPVR